MTAWKIRARLGLQHNTLIVDPLSLLILLTWIRIDDVVATTSFSFSPSADCLSDCDYHQHDGCHARPSEAEIPPARRMVWEYASAGGAVAELLRAKRSTLIGWTIPGFVCRGWRAGGEIAIYRWLEICAQSYNLGSGCFSIALSHQAKRYFPQLWLLLRISAKLIRGGDM